MNGQQTSLCFPWEIWQKYLIPRHNEDSWLIWDKNFKPQNKPSPTASSRVNMFLPIFVTLWDAQNRSNNCNFYANQEFPSLTHSYQNSPHTLHFYGPCKYVFVTNVSRTWRSQSIHFCHIRELETCQHFALTLNIDWVESPIPPVGSGSLTLTLRLTTLVQLWSYSFLSCLKSINDFHSFRKKLIEAWSPGVCCFLVLKYDIHCSP